MSKIQERDSNNIIMAESTEEDNTKLNPHFCYGKFIILISIFYFFLWPRLLPFPCPIENSQTNIFDLQYNWTILLKAHLTFEETLIGDLHSPVGPMSQLTQYQNITTGFVEKIIWKSWFNTFKWTYLGGNNSVIDVSDYYRFSGPRQDAQNCTIWLKIERKYPTRPDVAIKPGRYPCEQWPDFMSLTIDRFELRKVGPYDIY